MSILVCSATAWSTLCVIWCFVFSQEHNMAAICYPSDELLLYVGCTCVCCLLYCCIFFTLFSCTIVSLQKRDVWYEFLIHPLPHHSLLAYCSSVFTIFQFCILGTSFSFPPNCPSCIYSGGGRDLVNDNLKCVCSAGVCSVLNSASTDFSSSKLFSNHTLSWTYRCLVENSYSLVLFYIMEAGLLVKYLKLIQIPV
jgi:hypothetical protein